MKKLTLLIALFFVVLITMCSCDRVAEQDIIVEIKRYTTETSVYKVKDGAEFFAPKHLYKVGDTVKFCK